MPADNTESFLASKKLRRLIYFGYITCDIVTNHGTLPAQNHYRHIDPNVIIYITVPRAPVGSSVTSYSFIAGALKTWIIGYAYITLEFNDGATVKLHYRG